MAVVIELSKWTGRMSSAYALPMPAEDEVVMSNRAFRVSDALWDDYGKACRSLGTTRSDDLRRHMVATVATYERKQRLIARESAES